MASELLEHVKGYYQALSRGDADGRPVLRNDRIEIRDLIGETPH